MNDWPDELYLDAVVGVQQLGRPGRPTRHGYRLSTHELAHHQEEPDPLVSPHPPYLPGVFHAAAHSLLLGLRLRPRSDSSLCPIAHLDSFCNLTRVNPESRRKAGRREVQTISIFAATSVTVVGMTNVMDGDGFAHFCMYY